MTVFKTFRAPQENFNPLDDKIWKNDVFKLGKGKVFKERALLYGFHLETPITVGAVTITSDKAYIKNFKATVSSRCTVVELVYQDQIAKTADGSETAYPVSQYVEPFWFIHALFVAFQLNIDSWVGLRAIQFLDTKDNVILEQNYPNLGLSDSRFLSMEPKLDEIDLDSLFKYIEAQFIPDIEGKIDRYTKACTEIILDGVVDFTIILDALLAHKTKREVSHKIAVRGARILASKPNELEDWYKVIKFIYNLRSEIVHNNKEELQFPKGKNLESFKRLGMPLTGDFINDRLIFSNYIRRIVKEVLIYFIENPEKFSKDFLLKLELGLDS